MGNLFEAIENGDIGQVWRLIQDRNQIDQLDATTELTALALAAEAGSVEIVRMLLAAGADPDQGGLTTPLEAAVVEGHVEVTRALLEASANVNQTVEDGFSPLMTAAATGNIQLVRLLLTAGGRPRAKNQLGDTAISLAEAEGYDTIARTLREWRRPKKDTTAPPPPAVEVRKPPATKKKRRTPSELPKRLPKKTPAAEGGANEAEPLGLFHPTPSGSEADNAEWALTGEPLFAATTEASSSETLAWFLGMPGSAPSGSARSNSAPSAFVPPASAAPAPAPPIFSSPVSSPRETRPAPEVPPLSLPQTTGSLPVSELSSRDEPKIFSELRKLIRGGAVEAIRGLIARAELGIDDRDHKGRTPLILAAAQGNPEIVRLLIKAGAQLELTDQTPSGASALVAAVCSTSTRRDEALRIMVEAGADVNQACGKHCWTPLMHAAESDVYLDIGRQGSFGLTTKTLIALGADLEMKDRRGHTVWLQIKRSAMEAPASSPYRRRLHQILRILEQAGAQPHAS